MVRYISILLLTLIFAATLFAQRHDRQHRHRRFENRLHRRNCGIIFGKVAADSTQDELPGVNITVSGTNLGAASGPDGNYIITGVPIGSYTLRATMMGYDISEKPIEVRAGAEISADFVLTESVIEMNEIVVTGTGMPTLYQDSPVKTAVVRRELIEKQKFNNLAEAIDFQTGVRVEGNCQNCNFTQVRLLGLEGHHAQILIDSNPVVSSLAGVYGLEQLPREMIERVEIVKGGGSSLYGGQAMAGVVNLITRRPTHNEFSLDYNNGTIADARDQRIGGTISRVNESGTSKAILYGNLRNRDPYDHNGDGFSEMGVLKQEAAGANWYFTPNERSELAVQLHYVHEDRRGGNKFDLAPHLADIAEWTETFRYGGSFAWNQTMTPLLDVKAYASLALTNRDSYYGAEQDENAYGTTENPLLVSGLQSTYLLGRHSIIAGVQFKQDAILDEAVAYNRLIDETYTDLGFILQDTYTIGKNEKTELVYGARLDKHSEISSLIASPRVALKSQLNPSLVFRGGYSSGFKAPQVFDEDLHITQVGGEGKIIRNSDNLQEERGHTFYGGLEYQGIVEKTGVKIGVNGFYTKIEDTFLLTAQDDPLTDEMEFYRINGSGVAVQNGLDGRPVEPRSQDLRQVVHVAGGRGVRAEQDALPAEHAHGERHHVAVAHRAAEVRPNVRAGADGLAAVQPVAAEVGHEDAGPRVSAGQGGHLSRLGFAFVAAGGLAPRVEEQRPTGGGKLLQERVHLRRVGRVQPHLHADARPVAHEALDRLEHVPPVSRLDADQDPEPPVALGQVQGRPVAGVQGLRAGMVPAEQGRNPHLLQAEPVRHLDQQPGVSVRILRPEVRVTVNDGTWRRHGFLSQVSTCGRQFRGSRTATQRRIQCEDKGRMEAVRIHQKIVWEPVRQVPIAPADALVRWPPTEATANWWGAGPYVGASCRLRSARATAGKPCAERVGKTVSR